MTGCITLPLRVAALLLVLLAVAAGWFYRDEIVRFGRRQLGVPEPPSPVGAPAPGAAGRGRARMDSLSRARADSVVLTPVELASLMAEELGRTPTGVPESLTVELREREVAIRGRVSTTPIPAAIRDLLGGALGATEAVEVAGALTLRRAGIGELEVQRVRVRGFPIPRDLADRVVGRYAPRTAGATVLFDVPAAITGIRVTPRGVILYGGAER